MSPINLKRIWKAVVGNGFKPFPTVLVLLAFFSLVCILTAFAQGINIPAGTTVLLNSGTLNSNGDVNLDGTLTVTTGEVTLLGDWNENGNFNAGTGTVDFVGVTGTQTITTDEPFFNLGHSGSTGVETNNDLDINGSFVNLGGTPFVTNNNNMNVAGDWANFSDATFVAGVSTVVFDGTGTQQISGDTTYYNFYKVITTAGTLVFEAAAEQTITNSLTMTGTVGELLRLESDSPPTMWEISLLPGGTQTLRYLSVGDSNAIGGLLLVAGTTSVESPVGSTINWSFGAATLTWEGDSVLDPNDWDDPTNWDLGFVPTSVDTAIIPGSAPAFPELDDTPSLVEVANLTIQSNASVSLLGQDLTINGTLSNDGEVFLFGDETVTIANPDTTSGTFVFTGNGVGGAENIEIPQLDYFNIQINDNDGGTADSFLTDFDLSVFGSLVLTASEFDISTNPDNTLTVGGTIDVQGGTFTGTSGNIDLNGGINISSGTFIAPDGTHTFNIAGDFVQSAGTFTHSSGTVILDGTTQFISANNTDFASFLKTTTVNSTLIFDSSIPLGNEPSFATNLTLAGTSGGILYIQSDTPTVEAFMSLLAGGTQDIQFVEVRDNNASGGLTLIGRNSSEPFNNNTNWIFGGATITWQGDSLIDPTDWDDPTNWDVGIVPGPDDTAVIPVTANDPILNSTVNIEELIVNSGATVTLDGNDFTIDGTLSLDGTITLIGNEAVTIGIHDTDSGVFEYIGTGTGAAQTIVDFGATDYYIITINGTGATPDTFVTVAGTLTAANSVIILSGNLDISTNSGALVVNGTLSVGGSLTAVSGTIDVNGDVIVTATGTLSAPTSGQSFTVSGDWTMTVGGTLLHNSGAVTFDDAGSTTTIVGDTTFSDLTSTAPGKQFFFTDGSDQTILDDMTIQGASGNEIVFRSTGGGAFFQTFPNGPQFVQFIDVEDANAVTNVVNCFNCIDNDPGSTVNWVFAVLAIIVPGPGETTDLTPTIIGAAAPGATVEIQDETATVIGTVVADANGNFRFEIDPADALSVGVHTLTPFVGVGFGASVTFTTVAAPTAAQQPTITSHSDGDVIIGATPTIEGFGAPNEAVEILASDANGNLLLTVVGTGVTDGTGFYSITVSTPLVKGLVFISVTISDVASDILEVQFTDPFGVVFDSLTDIEIENATVTIFNATTGLPAVPGVELDASDPNPFITASNGFYGWLTVQGTYFVTVTADSYTYPSILNSFPAGRIIVTGSKGEVFTVTGTIQQIDMPMDPSTDFLRIEKDANKKEVRIGEVVTYTITIENPSANDAQGVQIQDKIPPGFKYMNGRVLLDDVPIADPTGNRPLVFDIGTVTAGQTRILRYQLVVGAGVTVGDYENVAFAKHSVTGIVLSNVATESVKVVLDPLFDLGTVIGKVFFDRNENGLQDEPQYFFEEDTMITEDPVPNVRIVMEDGAVITTDNEGKFSVPAVMPGRHLLRLDERTLPEGSYLTTDKAVVVDVTPGLMVKVNFGVNIDYEAVTSEDFQFFVNKVNVQQDTTQKPKPRLNASLFGNEIGVYNNIFVTAGEFRIFTNYPLFIETWRLEIVDKDTKELVKMFEGDRLTIQDPILWDGKDVEGKYISLDRNYEYVVIVEDKKGNFNETQPKALPLRVLADEMGILSFRKELEEKRKNYAAWVEEEYGKDITVVSNILIDGESVLVDPMKTRLQSIRVMQNSELLLEVPVAEKHGLTAQELLEKDVDLKDIDQRKVEIILPQGEYQLVVQEEEREEMLEEGREGRIIEGVGESVEVVGAAVKTYKKDVKVGEDYLFFVGMGDAKMGYNFYEGSMEPVKDDEYKKGFYSEGKLAYYLKGKILGKYIITSSFDSERDQKELLRNLDPDKYYPVYGDASTIDYQATNTQGNLYLLIEWDKSSMLWGNYDVSFGNTEFAQFSRTLYGGKVDFETVSTTPFGDPRTKVVAFRARAQQRSAHVEFLATGGSVYYTKHKDVIEGSDKVKIEVRDKVTGLVIVQREMVESADYEMDYEDGRFIFWQPVPMLVDTYSIISSDLLNGNPVYVVMDYEYDVKDKFDEATVGARFQQAVTDEIIIGGTYVKEGQDTQDYVLKGTDVTLKLGPDVTVKAEYAQTESEVQGAFVSTDGGLNFTELATAPSAEGVAYGIKGDARIFNRITTSSYYKWVDQDFSTSATTAQQGKELYGTGFIVDITDETRLLAKYDVQRLIDDGNLQTQVQVGADETATTLVQLVHDMRQMRLTAEYRRQEANQAITEEILAGRIDYVFTDSLAVYAQMQRAIVGSGLDSTTFGMTLKPTDRLTITAEQTFGEDGTATKFAGQYDISERLSLTGEYAMLRDLAGVESATGSVGAIARVIPGVEIKTSMGLTPDGLSPAVNVTGAASVDVTDHVKITSEAMATQQDGVASLTTKVGALSEYDLTDRTKLLGEVGVSDTDGARASTAKVGTAIDLTDKAKILGELGVLGSGGTQAGTAKIGTSIDFDDAKLTGELTTLSQVEGQAMTLKLGGTKQVDEKTQTETTMEVTESPIDGRTTNFTFGSKKQLTDTISMLTSRTFGTTADGESTQNKYSLVREKDGKKLEGSLTRIYAQDKIAVSSSNIFGLTGGIDDRWALTGSYEKASVENLDFTHTERDAIALAVGYVKTDPQTGKTFKSSTKIEYRIDDGVEDKKQYLLYNATEGNITPELSLFTKAELSKTENESTSLTEAQHKELVVGGAYRPLAYDQLNLLARYTYLENKGPQGQEDFADVEEERAHVIALDAIYDINESWQLTEKFAYRISDEKVIGFDFTKTHTWLMIHRLKYNIDSDWSVAGEFRQLAQQEAQDVKRGFLIEASRSLTEYAQLGVGYNFTDFNDDLTQLDYTSQGPFVRITGSLYDKSPQEIAREKQRWLEEKIKYWAWRMVSDELSRSDSPILQELNGYFMLAEVAYEKGHAEQAKEVYRDIIMAGHMMIDEAGEYIRGRVKKEEELKEMKNLADQYFKNRQFKKAKEILEKIVEEAQNPVLE
ncbi:MAG TPA: Ig-like domain-containing protein [Candidatus Omnitrophota bacterium]|nr:Ig-like domain-containing protein [Candidatus Omnitrophota bacterium]